MRDGISLGHVIAGAAIANAAVNAHAHAQRDNEQRSHEQRGGQAAPQEPMPAPTWNGGVDSVNAGTAGGSASTGAAAATAGGTASGNAAGNASGTVQPAPGTATTSSASTGKDATQARGPSVFGTLASLALLACMIWGVVALVRRSRRKRGAAKPNYSFERN